MEKSPVGFSFFPMGTRSKIKGAIEGQGPFSFRSAKVMFKHGDLTLNIYMNSMNS